MVDQGQAHTAALLPLHTAETTATPAPLTTYLPSSFASFCMLSAKSFGAESETRKRKRILKAAEDHR
jgi:hypothetical protein